MEACGCCNGAADGAAAPPSTASSSSLICLCFLVVQIRAGGEKDGEGCALFSTGCWCDAMLQRLVVTGDEMG